MKTIEKQEFGGERPLYCEHGLVLRDSIIHAGESSLKEGSDILAENCRFEGKYPFWECNNVTIKNCTFTEGARAALWYARNYVMEDSLVEAPKMFREMDGLTLRRVKMPNAAETLWGCRGVKVEGLEVEKGDYIFMHGKDLDIRDFKLQGNYSFQYCKDVVIRDSELHTKDAFWQTENVTVYDSFINGEYLGWYSKNLHLVRCRIGGTQPLCYCEGLVLEDCIFEPDADLAFEYSDVQAVIKGNIPSVKNPRHGSVKADSIGEIIIDDNIKAPGDCTISAPMPNS